MHLLPASCREQLYAPRRLAATRLLAHPLWHLSVFDGWLSLKASAQAPLRPTSGPPPAARTSLLRFFFPLFHLLPALICHSVAALCFLFPLFQHFRQHVRLHKLGLNASLNTSALQKKGVYETKQRGVCLLFLNSD